MLDFGRPLAKSWWLDHLIRMGIVAVFVLVSIEVIGWLLS
jgi:hypothetical protein